MAQQLDTSQLQQQLQQEERLHLVETLQPREFEKGHLPGAVCIPFTRIGGEARRRFNQDDAIVVYCHDEDCTASTRAAEKLESLGFTRVYEYPPGKRGWQADGLRLES